MAAETARKYRARKKEHISARARKYAKANKDRIDRINAEWRAKNRAHHNAYKAEKRAEKTQATPAWADRQIIRDFYAEADYFGMHVDHIVPLRSRLVCGLHCEANLQLLSAAENISKKNRHWPDMPGQGTHP